MTEDLRCCGSGTCIIDNDGRCWCGQQWDGQKMCPVPLAPVLASASDRLVQTTPPEPGTGTASGSRP